MLVGCAAAAAGISIYGPMMNWWGMPQRYGVGACANLIFGWVVAAAVGCKVLQALVPKTSVPEVA